MMGQPITVAAGWKMSDVQMAGYQCRICGERFITGEDFTVLMVHHEQEHPHAGIARFDPI
jgi:hypothetical protein